jgi:hypothetical protein
VWSTALTITENYQEQGEGCSNGIRVRAAFWHDVGNSANFTLNAVPVDCRLALRVHEPKPMERREALPGAAAPGKAASQRLLFWPSELVAKRQFAAQGCALALRFFARATAAS